MTCNDCIHQGACFDWCRGFGEEAELCKYFSDKSGWTHLPCKTGGTIFMPWRWNGENGIAQITVLQIVLAEDKSYVETDLESDDYDYFAYYNGGRFWFDDFGIMVFPTREEAEKALAERINKND